MNPWEGIASQVLGMGMATQQRDLSGLAGYDPYSRGYYIPLGSTTTTSNTFHDCQISDNLVEKRVEEPPDEFTQLSNHKFHELLTKFKETT